MGIVEGKTFLVTGVLTQMSIAYEVARLAQEEGAKVILTGFGRGLSLTKRVAEKLPQDVEVLELDVTSQEHLDSLQVRLKDHATTIDGVLHSIAFAPKEALGGNFLNTEWNDVATALQVSAYSLKALTVAVQPMLATSSSVVGLTFDAKVAWPIYDWMGVAKAALEATGRYLARDLGQYGVRVNMVAAGPLGSIAAKGIPDFHRIESIWSDRAPLGWNSTDPVPTAKTCIALMSDWMPMTTGEVIHCDGGVHAVMG
jgi:enoyl-[acyl-carrier protein] reductase I